MRLGQHAKHSLSKSCKNINGTDDQGRRKLLIPRSVQAPHRVGGRQGHPGGHRFTLIPQANSPVSPKRLTVPGHSPKMLRILSSTSSQRVSPAVSWSVSSSLPYYFDGSCSCSWVYLLEVDTYGYARPMRHSTAKLQAKVPACKAWSASCPTPLGSMQ